MAFSSLKVFNVLRCFSSPEVVLVCVESLFVLVTISQAAYYYADFVAFVFHQYCQQVVKCMHVCDSSTLSLIALSCLESHGLAKALCQGLVNVQCRKPPEEVTTTADVLDKFGVREEATQLRGWLVC